MVIKKISGVILICMLTVLLSIFAVSAENATSIQVEQIYSKMPEITVWFHIDNNDNIAQNNITAALDDVALGVKSLSSFNDQIEGVLYLFLVDISSSISDIQINATKRAIRSFTETLKSSDRLALISFGSKVTVLLDGTESSEVVQEKIDALKAGDDKTLFYDGINKAIELSESSSADFPSRKVAFIISDGVDYNAGGYTKEEILSRLKQGGLPVYALGLNSGSKAALDSFGTIARESGGKMSTISGQTLSAQLIEYHEYILSCKTLLLQASSNIADGQQHKLKLKVDINGKQLENSCVFTPFKWIADSVHPSVKSIIQLDGSKLRIEFSERLLGAEKIDAYILKDSFGKNYKPQSLLYTEKGNTPNAEIEFDGLTISGKYTISFSGITDNSMEKNPLTDKKIFNFSGSPKLLRYLKLIFIDFWWVVLIAALFIIFILIYLVLKKRKGIVIVEGKIGFGDQIDKKYAFITPKAKAVTLIVTDMQGNCKKVETDIDKSFFVGRADINNLYFDDDHMSRQHFIIETDKDQFYISDLETTNGTYLNGVRITGRRKLVDNDVITAGREKIVFKLQKKEPQ